MSVVRVYTVCDVSYVCISPPPPPQVGCRSTVSAAISCPMRMRRCFLTGWTSTKTWTSLSPTTTSTRHITPTSSDDSLGASHRSRCIGRSYWPVVGQSCIEISWKGYGVNDGSPLDIAYLYGQKALGKFHMKD